MPAPGWTSTPGAGRRADQAHWWPPPSVPRCSAASAASAACSLSTPTGTAGPSWWPATDGVGTKALVAQDLARFDTIGIDLVAMCVDDLVCQGAEPLFFLDYISCGTVEPVQMAELVAGVAEGCRQVGAALLGGEMAEHPGVMKPGEFDLVGLRRRRGRAGRRCWARTGSGRATC